MSMFSFPADMKLDEMTKSMLAMTDWTKTGDMNVAPMMVYPFGAAAAATAVGIGMAGQMSGLMMGAMQAALQSQGASLGVKPDLSWMMPALAKDLAPKEPENAETAEDVAAKTAEIVELTPTAKATPAKSEAAKSVAAKSPPAKTTRAKKSAAKPVADKPVAAKPVAEKSAADKGSAAVVEKLKSDAAIAAEATTEAAAVAPAQEPVAGSAIEPEDYRRPVEIEKPENPDDLKLISGVGPKLEQVLNGIGIWTLGQIADWTAEEVAWVDDYLQFYGRITRDDWVSQAQKLAKGGANA